MLQKRAYLYRFYPTDEQAQQLAKTFGCARFVYNWGLRQRTDAWFKDGARMNYHATAKALTTLKQQPETEWLSEVSNVVMQQALRHLDGGFRNFFAKRTKYPTPKRKHGAQSASYMSNGFTLRDGKITLAKQKEPLAIRWSRPLPEGAIVSSLTVSRDTAGRHFVSLLVEEEIAPLPPVETAIGIDVGIKSFAVTSAGEVIANPKHLAKKLAKLRRYQRKCARKVEAAKAQIGLKGKTIPKGVKVPRSNNYRKAVAKVARLHTKVSDARNDFLHQKSTRIVRENQVVAVEDLAVSNMVKNPKLARAISDAGWAKFRTMLEYKCDWYGRTFVATNRWLPTSKRCNECGHLLVSLPLSVREWVCPECGAIHNRDENAAKNILAAAMATLAEQTTAGHAGSHVCQI